MTALERLVARRSQAVPRLVRRLGQWDGLVQQPVEAVALPRLRVNGRWVLSFASTNYLGLGSTPAVQHAIGRAARNWGGSLGMPRLFTTDCLTAQLERELAKLVGQAGALVFPSTTHIALDVLPLLAGPNSVLFIDEWAYPISHAGAHTAAWRGARIRRFPHNSAQALAHALQAFADVPEKVIVCDGVYSAGGHPVRLREFTRLAQAYDAVVYVDDAHGVGVLGCDPTSEIPYGHGGGGTPGHFGLAPGYVVHVGSLSKAFGVPVAFVAGPKAFVDHLRVSASSYTHSSPPALSTVAAALATLRIHAVHGEMLRHRLAHRVRRFRLGLAHAGIKLCPNQLFPIQTVHFSSPLAAEWVGRALRRMGIWPVLQFGPSDHPRGGVLRFVITAHHTAADIDKAVAAVQRCLQDIPMPDRRKLAIIPTESTPTRRDGPDRDDGVTRARRNRNARY